MGQITFVRRTLDEIENSADSRRGRVSYPIIKGFMETGYQVAEVDLTESGRKPMTLQVLLKSFIDTHQLPVKVLLRRGRLFLMRLDIDEQGKEIPNWKELLEEEKRATVGEVEDITATVVKRA